MLTAGEIIEEAAYRAKVPGYQATFALRNLNAVLSDICQHYDYALARGKFAFNFNPSLATMYGSGPYPLPLDYLRTSGSSGATGASRSVWYLYPTPAFPSGQPIYMVPIDLAEFDQYPQFPSRSTPELWATDMGGPLTQRIVLKTTGDTTGASATIANCASTAGLLVGLTAAGEGIEPGSTIAAVNASTGLVTLDRNTTGAISGASVFFGIAPVAYAFPPPAGSYPVTCRYQRQMPDVTRPEQTVWFPDEGYLITALAGRLAELSDDERSLRFKAMADQSMQKYAAKADDKTNRSQAVQLDPRQFGGGTPYSRARNTKYQGW